jgi:hypothetical protein
MNHLLLCLAIAAPAPFPRPAPAVPLTVPAFAGHWQITWGTNKFDAILRADGYYESSWLSTRYAGRWGISNGRLWFREAIMPLRDESYYSVHTIKIKPGTREGVMEKEGTIFRMEKWKIERLKYPKGE